MKLCTIPNCTKKHKSHGMCDTHYSYWKRTGEVGERRVKTLAERLWAKVDKSAGHGPNGDCWEWRGYVHPTGYGQLAKDAGGKNVNSNRAAWIVTHGEIQDGLWVLHTCDNRLCCNPDHLWLGTPQDNTNDMIRKGRKRLPVKPARGEQISISKLTEDMVRAMRAEPPMTFKALGEKYGVSAGTANKVILRQLWTHI